MAEWLKAVALKVTLCKNIMGSNPILSLFCFCIDQQLIQRPKTQI
jgi:hypothetical protein